MLPFTGIFLTASNTSFLFRTSKTETRIAVLYFFQDGFLIQEAILTTSINNYIISMTSKFFRTCFPNPDEAPVIKTIFIIGF
jgi:hypothetical protein